MRFGFGIFGGLGIQGLRETCLGAGPVIRVEHGF